MPRVFISHSSLDHERIEREIISLLRLHGVETWYSIANIKSASEWERQILTGLKESDWFLIVLTPRSVSSEWVGREVHWAFLKRKDKIIPVMLETCEPDDLHLGLLPLQFIDFRYDVAAAQDRLLAIWSLDKATQVKTHYHAALGALAQEDWRTAIQHLEWVLRLDPAHSQAKAELNSARQHQGLAALYDGGLTHLREKRWQEALTTLREVQRIDGNYKKVVDSIALANAALQKEEAERLYRDALDAADREEWTAPVEQPESVERVTENAELQAREQKSQQPIEDFYRKAEQKHQGLAKTKPKKFETPRDVSLGVLLALLLLLIAVAFAGLLFNGIPFLATEAQSPQTATPVNTPSPEEPFVRFERARRQIDKDPRGWLMVEVGKELLSSAIQSPLDSPNAEFLYLYGRANLLIGNVDEASKAFDAAIAKLDADPTSANATIKKEAIFGLAVVSVKTQIHRDRWKVLYHYEELTKSPTNTNAP